MDLDFGRLRRTQGGISGTIPTDHGISQVREECLTFSSLGRLGRVGDAAGSAIHQRCDECFFATLFFPSGKYAVSFGRCTARPKT
jgi:hypothetical protein